MISIQEYLYNIFEHDLVDTVLEAKKYNRIIPIENSYNKINKKIDISICKYLYQNYNMPIYKIAMLYGVSDATIKNYFLKDNELKLKGHNMGKNSFNNYFEKINSPDKAYFLGLIVADGCIQNNGNCKCTKKNLSIALTYDDSYILEKFNVIANFNTNLIISHKNDAKPRMQLTVHSSKIYDDLIKLGIKEDKSHTGTCMPKLRKDLIPHFIRGVFDGDGIAFSKGYVGFCGDNTLLLDIKKYLVLKGMKDAKIWFNKNNNIYYMQWGSYRDREIFVKTIYKNKEDLFLKRKYDKIINKLNNRPSIQ